MNADLTPKQIARIERIRAERAAAKDNKHYYRECVGCGDTPCVKPDDPIDPPYCEYCTRICDEITVEDRDSPNIFPYKKCRECGERKSGGNYTNNYVWQCDDCALDEMYCGHCDCDLGPDSGNTVIHTSIRGYKYCESCEDKEPSPQEWLYIDAIKAGNFEAAEKMVTAKLAARKLTAK
jgi:hypothetical protein